MSWYLQVSFKLSLFRLGDSSKITRYDYVRLVFPNRVHFPHYTVSVFLYVTQTCTHILRVGASILPFRVLASGPYLCGGNNKLIRTITHPTYTPGRNQTRVIAVGGANANYCATLTPKKYILEPFSNNTFCQRYED